MGDSTNLELVQEAYDDIANGDIERLVAKFDDDVVWVEAEGGPYGGTYRGPDAVIENVFAPLGEDWEEFVVDTDRFVDGGDTIVGLATYRGTHAETGESFEAPVAHVWDVADGKITRFEQYVDTALHNEPIEA